MCIWKKIDASWGGGYPITLYYSPPNAKVLALFYQLQGEIEFGFQVTPNTEQGLEDQR